jgi:hypothetical protein
MLALRFQELSQATWSTESGHTLHRGPLTLSLERLAGYHNRAASL